jgi:hypothetical protein
MASQILPSNTFTTAKWIVSATSSDGTHTTIGAALTSASSGDTIFIRPGTYTENLTLKAGVNLTAFGSDSSLDGTGKVIISGTCTLTGAGSVTISGIQLQTNSAALLAVTGSAASVVNLNNCYLNCSNNTGITYSSSSGSSAININNCTGNLGTTGIAYFSHSSGGTLTINNSYLTNTGSSTTANTVSAGLLAMYFTNIFSPLSISTSTTTNGINLCQINTAAINTACITTSGTGSIACYNSNLASGTASSVSVGVNTTVGLSLVTITSSNTNAVTGAGTLNYQGVSFAGTSFKMNTTTQVGGVLQGGVAQAPSTGFIGEQIRGAATAVSITTATPKNITSISVTPGVWDINCDAIADDTTANIGAALLGISTNTGSFTGTVRGDSYVELIGTILLSSYPLSISQFRVVITTTTVYYLVIQINGSGTLSADGRISAVRVA